MQHPIEQELRDDIRKSGSVHYIYPEHEIKPISSVPEGYKSFYISHLGRHGSRQMINNQDFIDVITILNQANHAKVMTEVGQTLLEQLNTLWPSLEGRDQDLTEKGKQQHRNIARRMFLEHSHLFSQPIDICARATVVPRCLLSMMYFCDELKSLNPKLNIRYDASEKYQKYLNFHTDQAIAFRDSAVWKHLYKNVEKEAFQASRFIASLFHSEDWIKHHLVPSEFMHKVYNIASITQNLDTELDFYPLFTFQELFAIWQCKNHEQYVFNANASINNNLMLDNAKPLLKNIIDSADVIIKNNQSGAHLRFAHDGNIIPLTLLMHIEGAFAKEDQYHRYWQVWQDYKIAPMAGNVQFVFYKHEDTQADILVKVLLHENEVSIPPLDVHCIDNKPLYPWQAMKSFYETLLAE